MGQNDVFEDKFDIIYVFSTRNPNLRSILKPEVEFMVFLRMRSNKITKKWRKMPLKCSFKA